MKAKCVTHPDYRHLQGWLEQLHDDTGTNRNVVYNARNIITTENVGNEEVTIKSFHIPSAINRLVYTLFRKPKALRSYENAIKLIESGILTPAPIGYKECYSRGMLDHSYYIYRFLHNVNDIRWWERRADRKELLEHLAIFIARLHKAGIWHKDFSPGNILHDSDWNFYLIDINRMEFGVSNPRKLMENFRSLHDSPEETAYLARLYAHHSPFRDTIGEEGLIEMALDARRRYKQGQARKHRIKNLLGKLKNK